MLVRMEHMENTLISMYVLIYLWICIFGMFDNIAIYCVSSIKNRKNVLKNVEFYEETWVK